MNHAIQITLLKEYTATLIYDHNLFYKNTNTIYSVLHLLTGKNVDKYDNVKVR